MKRELYHPRYAVPNPEAYYERAFENYPRPWIVPIVGGGATRLTRPTISYHDAETATEYFGRLPDDLPIVMTFTHDGLEKFHDPMAAAAAVFGTPFLLDRVRDIRVWAAIPYVLSPETPSPAKKLANIATNKLINWVGSVPVIRSQDYEKYGLNPTLEQRTAVTGALCDTSARHLEVVPRSILAAFPAGTRGGATLREGVGIVMEQVEEAAVIPIALVSDSAETSNRPENLRIAFGEHVLAEPGLDRNYYTKAIENSLHNAAASVSVATS